MWKDHIDVIAWERTKCVKEDRHETHHTRNWRKDVVVAEMNPHTQKKLCGQMKSKHFDGNANK